MSTRLRTFGIFLWLLITATAFAQTIVPEKCGLSPERLKVMDEAMNGYVKRKEIAGGVLLIARKGQIGHLKAFGLRDVETGDAMKPDALFRIASLTKAITIVATMTLFEDGHFNLDDPLSKFIPEFKDMNVLVQDTGKNATYHLEKAKSPITIRHLLNHSSGLTYDAFAPKYLHEMYTENKIYAGLGPTAGTIGEMVKRLARLPLADHPGERWRYGVNMEVLSYLIELWSGKPFDVYLRERLFIPLNMTDTYFYLPKEKVARLATMYGANEAGQIEKIKGVTKLGQITYSDYAEESRTTTYFAGGGGLVSSANDYYKFLQMLLNNGTSDGKRILGRKTVELITSEQTANMFSWWAGYGSGFGFWISRGPAATGRPGTQGAYGWLGIFNLHYIVDPGEDLIAILMTQTLPNKSDIEDKFKNLTYTVLAD
jgi:CubicO group peptidase (beta-lactamase class C family)